MFRELFLQDIFHEEQPDPRPELISPFRDGDGIIEVCVLAPGAHMVYSFEVRRGYPLNFGAWSNRLIAIALTSYAQFDRWDRARAPFDELESLERRAGRLPEMIRFRARRKDCYQVVVMNLTDRRAKVIVEAQCLS